MLLPTVSYTVQWSDDAILWHDWIGNLPTQELAAQLMRDLFRQQDTVRYARIVTVTRGKTQENTWRQWPSPTTAP